MTRTELKAIYNNVIDTRAVLWKDVVKTRVNHTPCVRT